MPTAFPGASRCGIIAPMNLANIDLNLLKALHAVLDERSVSRAAERIGRSQPAVSAALARLRAHFNDPLVQRGRDGLALTPFAKTLQEPVSRLMAAAEACFAFGQTFDPTQVRTTFTLAAPDFVALALVPALVEAIEREAPNVSLRVLQADRDPAIEMLRDGRCDIAIGTFTDDASDVRVAPLFEQEFACVVRRGHAFCDRPPDLEGLLSVGHVVVSAAVRNLSIFDEMLRTKGLVRRTPLSVTSFVLAPYVLARSDLVGVFSHAVCERLARHHDLHVLPLPIRVPPLAARIAWHLRTDQDAAALWLRRRIEAILPAEL